ncbi:Ankyrin repeat and MYND domain-containing protein 1 [Galemys pyrenaicus]|uniref:Ankyrin repeat and MYND domain-containing protein 1 n=1 Tax=Galemys pyrenaicus TaxID=202257 RepID=A0A8J5ZQ78_GALPY|nr:Ankyrin repeat and MYND domain-containing protein 1 [Galemys pyrenaicus]
MYRADERFGPGVETYPDGHQDVGLWFRDHLIQLCTEVPGAFSIRSYPEFEDFLTQPSARVSLAEDRVLGWGPSEEQDPLFYEYKRFLLSDGLTLPPELSLYSTDSGHLPLTRSLRRDLDARIFLNCTPPFVEDGEAWLVKNETPLLRRMQEHAYRFRNKRAHSSWRMDTVLAGDRSDFGPSGPKERLSEELILRAGEGDYRWVRGVLRDNLVSPDVADARGYTALASAAVHSHRSVVSLLLDSGADVNKRSDEGLTALSMCFLLYYPVQAFRPNIAERTLPSFQDLPRLLEVPSPASLPTPRVLGSAHDGLASGPSGLELWLLPTPLEEERLSQESSEARSSPPRRASLSLKGSVAVDAGAGPAPEGAPPRAEEQAPGSRESDFRSDASLRDFSIRLSQDLLEKGAQALSLLPAPLGASEADSGASRRMALSLMEWVLAGAGRAGGAGRGTARPGGAGGWAGLRPGACWTAGQRRPRAPIRSGLLREHGRGGAASGCSTPSGRPAHRPRCWRWPAPALPTLAGRLVGRAGLPQAGAGCELAGRAPGWGRPPPWGAALTSLCYRRRSHWLTIKLLLQRGADPNLSRVPMQALFLAVKAGDEDGVRLLLESGARTDVAFPSEVGRALACHTHAALRALTPLHIAVALPGEEAVRITELLLHAVTDVDARAADQDEAYKAGKLDLLPSSLKLSNEVGPPSCYHGQHGSALEEGGRTALHVACEREDDNKHVQEVVQLLLSHKANPNTLWSGHSPLSLSIASGNDLVVKELLAGGANPNLLLTRGLGSALCVACDISFEHRRSLDGKLALLGTHPGAPPPGAADPRGPAASAAVSLAGAAAMSWPGLPGAVCARLLQARFWVQGAPQPQCPAWRSGKPALSPQIDRLISYGADILQPVTLVQGDKAAVGTAVDYGYFRFFQVRPGLGSELCRAMLAAGRGCGQRGTGAVRQDRKIAHCAFHALLPAERETFLARKRLLDYMGLQLRRAVQAKESQWDPKALYLSKRGGLAGTEEGPGLVGTPGRGLRGPGRPEWLGPLRLDVLSLSSAQEAWSGQDLDVHLTPRPEAERQESACSGRRLCAPETLGPRAPGQDASRAVGRRQPRTRVRARAAGREEQPALADQRGPGLNEARGTGCAGLAATEPQPAAGPVPAHWGQQEARGAPTQAR